MFLHLSSTAEFRHWAQGCDIPPLVCCFPSRILVRTLCLPGCEQTQLQEPCSQEEALEHIPFHPQWVDLGSSSATPTTCGFFPLYKTAAPAQIQEREEISSVCAGEGDITKSFTKAKSELQQKPCVFHQITSLELPQIKALPKPSCSYQTKFPSQFGICLQYSFSSVFHRFWFCPWKTYLSHFLLGLGVYPWGNLARRSSRQRLYHVEQQRWWPK